MREEYSIKICERCGNAYRPTNSRQKCCIECMPMGRIVRTKKWHAINHEKTRISAAKWNKANHKQVRAGTVRYRKAHPEKAISYDQKRRALKYANTPLDEMLTSTEWLAILAVANGHCHYCGKEVKLTLDHVIPISKGGKHSKDNVVAACLHCNSSKGARTPEQWRAPVKTSFTITPTIYP